MITVEKINYQKEINDNAFNGAKKDGIGAALISQMDALIDDKTKQVRENYKYSDILYHPVSGLPFIFDENTKTVRLP